MEAVRGQDIPMRNLLAFHLCCKCRFSLAKINVVIVGVNATIFFEGSGLGCCRRGEERDEVRVLELDSIFDEE